MVFGGVWSIIFWVVIVGLVIWGVKKLVERDRGGSVEATRKKDALDIAKERYARGEITREQFEEVRRTLEQS